MRRNLPHHSQTAPKQALDYHNTPILQVKCFSPGKRIFFFLGQKAAGPAFAGPAESAFSSDQAQHQGKHHKHQRHPLGHLSQLGIHALGLVLGQEGIRAAGDGADRPALLPDWSSTTAMRNRPHRTWITVSTIIKTSILIVPFNPRARLQGFSFCAPPRAPVQMQKR